MLQPWAPPLSTPSCCPAVRAQSAPPASSNKYEGAGCRYSTPPGARCRGVRSCRRARGLNKREGRPAPPPVIIKGTRGTVSKEEMPPGAAAATAALSRCQEFDRQSDTYELVKARVRNKVVDFLGLVFSPTNLVSVSVSIGTVWGIALYESRLVTTEPGDWKFRVRYANHQARVIACVITTKWPRLQDLAIHNMGDTQDRARSEKNGV